MATWIVTGTTRGIGLELCRQLQARGDEAIAVCRSGSAELEAIGCRVIEGVDVGRGDAGAALAAAVEDLVSIDVLVNNAAIARWDTLETLDLDDARDQLEVNTLGPLRVTTALLPRLRSGAKIAFVSSMAGSIGDRPSGRNYGYRISKTALNMAGANLAHDLAPRGIHVAVLHPGFVRTAMTSGGGNVDPPEAAAGLIRQIDLLDASRSGRFFHADGRELPW